MNTTRASLLIRIRDPKDSVSWREFHELYAPLIYRYARKRGLGHDEAEEVRSSCFETIVKSIQEFDYVSAKGGFKAWLQKIVLNRVIDLKRKHVVHQIETDELRSIPDGENTPEQAFDEQWKLSHLSFCLERVRTKLPETTMRAFELLVDGKPVVDVCQELQINSNQVYKAKSKVLKLVREQMHLVLGFDSQID